MTKQANIKCSEYLNVKAKGESEKQIVSDLKKLAIQDGVEVRELVFEGILYMFKVHHWPPGNPQRTLESITKPLPIIKCGCGRTAVKHGLHLASKTERDFCVDCFSKLQGRHDNKIWRFN